MRSNQGFTAALLHHWSTNKAKTVPAAGGDAAGRESHGVGKGGPLTGWVCRVKGFQQDELLIC